jgi:hypothetical protein
MGSLTCQPVFASTQRLSTVREHPHPTDKTLHCFFRSEAVSSLNSGNEHQPESLCSIGITRLHRYLLCSHPTPYPIQQQLYIPVTDRTPSFEDATTRCEHPNHRLVHRIGVLKFLFQLLTPAVPRIPNCQITANTYCFVNDTDFIC